MSLRSLLVLPMAAALVAVPPPASAADAAVTVSGNQFGPGSVRVGLGDSVTWTFEDAVTHSTTSDEGFWDSGGHSSGETYEQVFGSAGTFSYHCTFHPHMSGEVEVPVRVTGDPDARRLRWSTGAAPEGRDFDVQVRRKGADAWKDFRSDTPKASASFEPKRAGTWQVRARTSDTGSGDSSGWSPVRTVAVS